MNKLWTFYCVYAIIYPFRKSGQYIHNPRTTTGKTMFSTQLPPEVTPERPRNSRRTLAVIAGVIVLLIAATVAFFTLRDSNDVSNEVASKPSSTDLGLFDINSTLPTTEPVYGPAPKDSVFNPNGSGFCSIWAHKGDTSVRLTCMVQPDPDSSVVTMVVAYDKTQIWSETYIEGRGVVASWSNGVDKTGGFVPIGK